MTGGVDAEKIYLEAEQAFAALAALLGEAEWFLDGDTPGLLDAELFAYSQLLVGGQLAWGDTELVKTLEKFENLVRHTQRLFQRCWGN